MKKIAKKEPLTEGKMSPVILFNWLSGEPGSLSIIANEQKFG